MAHCRGYRYGRGYGRGYSRTANASIIIASHRKRTETSNNGVEKSTLRRSTGYYERMSHIVRLPRNMTIKLSREAVAMQTSEPEGDSMSTVNRNSKQKLEFVIKSTWKIAIKSKWNIVVEC